MVWEFVSELFPPGLRWLLVEPVVKRGELGCIEIIARLLRRTLKGEATADEDHELIHQVGVLHDVCCADDRAASVGEIAQQLHELKLGRRIKAGGRFVEKQNGWPD